MTAVTHRTHPGTPYGGAAVGSPGYSGSLQTANGARAVQARSIFDQGNDLTDYSSLCVTNGNGILVTRDARFASILSHYKKTGAIVLSPQDPKYYGDAIKKLASISITRVMVANQQQWEVMEKRIASMK